MSGSAFPPLSGFKLVVAAIVLSLGNFMVVLDTTIANVAMPTISGYRLVVAGRRKGIHRDKRLSQGGILYR